MCRGASPCDHTHPGGRLDTGGMGKGGGVGVLAHPCPTTCREVGIDCEEGFGLSLYKARGFN